MTPAEEAGGEWRRRRGGLSYGLYPSLSMKSFYAGEGILKRGESKGGENRERERVVRLPS